MDFGEVVKMNPSLVATDAGESEAILCISAIHLLIRLAAELNFQLISYQNVV
jgi:hypothetical protein